MPFQGENWGKIGHNAGSGNATIYSRGSTKPAFHMHTCIYMPFEVAVKTEMLIFAVKIKGRLYELIYGFATK